MKSDRFIDTTPNKLKLAYSRDLSIIVRNCA